VEPNTEIKKLTEELGVYFEQNKVLSPLSARIFSMLILTDKDGLSFDQLIEGLDSCKSSISTNLQLLQATGRIVYFTKPGERKRYFKVSPNDIFDQLEKKIEQWETEKKMHLKVYEFKKNMLKNSTTYNEDKPGLRYTKTYARLADNFIRNLKQLKEDLKNPSNSNSNAI
jgi:DNA-binding transcriptional regulator GbsR (MarR family)